MTKPTGHIYATIQGISGDEDDKLGIWKNLHDIARRKFGNNASIGAGYNPSLPKGIVKIDLSGYSPQEIDSLKQKVFDADWSKIPFIITFIYTVDGKAERSEGWTAQDDQ